MEDAAVVLSRIPTYMLHQNIYLLALKALYLRKLTPYVRTVYIAIHSTKRSDSPEFIGNLKSTNVPYMPYLVTLGKMPCVTLIPI
jgi:hypothetical protein